LFCDWCGGGTRARPRVDNQRCGPPSLTRRATSGGKRTM
jgi:hypothetical protein